MTGTGRLRRALAMVSLTVVGCGGVYTGETTDADSTATTGTSSSTDASSTSDGDSEPGTTTGSTGDTEASTTDADTSTTDADTSTTGADTSTTGADTSSTGADTSSTGADTSTTGEVGPECGDGVVDPGEECDDGNTIDDDMCSALCHAPPQAIEFVCGDQTAKYGEEIGAPFYDGCPFGQVLIGFTGQIDGHQWHGNIAGVCGVPAVEVVEGAYAVRVTAAEPLPLRGSSVQDGATWSRLCPEDQIVVGFGGRTSAQIDQLTFACAPLVLAESADGFALARGEQVDLEAIGNNYGPELPSAMCPPDQIADGQRGRAAEDLEKFGLGCAIFLLSF